MIFYVLTINCYNPLQPSKLNIYIERNRYILYNTRGVYRTNRLYTYIAYIMYIIYIRYIKLYSVPTPWVVGIYIVYILSHSKCVSNEIFYFIISVIKQYCEYLYYIYYYTYVNARGFRFCLKCIFINSAFLSI
jgi:hypothetical protein